MKGMHIHMKYRSFYFILRALPCILLCVLLCLTACGKDNSPAERETFPKETFVPMADGGLILYDGLTTESFANDTNVTNWLIACEGADRNDHFGGYVFRHQSAEGENTVFTFLVYYPHGGEAMAVTPDILQSTDSHLLNLTYEAGEGVESYSLCLLKVTLNTDRAPRVRVIVDGEVPGTVVSVSSSPIEAP